MERMLFTILSLMAAIISTIIIAVTIFIIATIVTHAAGIEHVLLL
jgi:hypothetical protein